MKNKNYAMPFVFVAILLIPQLLFWWLVPATAIARFVIYIGATFINFATIVTLFIAYWMLSLRKVAGLAIVSGVLELNTFIVCAIMLAINITVRSAIYALVIVALIHLIFIIPMACSAFRNESIAISQLDEPTTNTEQNVLPPKPNYRSIDENFHKSNTYQSGDEYRALPPRSR